MTEDKQESQGTQAEVSGAAGETAKSGDKVRFHYHGTFTDGTTFDSSLEREPMEVTLGMGQLIPGVDSALIGMAIGGKKKVTVASEQAYGAHQEELMHTAPRDQMPSDLELKVGDMLEMHAPERPPLPVTVVELTEETVTLDANHPLAGKDLIFELELVSIGPDA